MQNLFQFIMYFVFGKHWLLFDLKHGYKATMFMNELELDMHRAKVRDCQKEVDELKTELQYAEEEELLSDETLIALLPEDQKENKKALYDLRKQKHGEQLEKITVLKNRIASSENDLMEANGELQKGYSITYQNRLKYDFIKDYKPKATYGEKDY